MFETMARGERYGRQFQGGMTRSSLCEKCNNFTGRKYGGAFGRWANQAGTFHDKLREPNYVLLPFATSALRVAKQIGAMTLSMSNVESIELPHFAHLRRLVLAPSARGRVPGFRFYVYLHYGDPVFQDCFFAINTTGGPSPMVYSSVGIPPLGYIATGDDPASREWAADLGLYDITHWFEQPLDRIRQDYLPLQCLRGALPFPPGPCGPPPRRA